MTESKAAMRMAARVDTALYKRDRAILRARGNANAVMAAQREYDRAVKQALDEYRRATRKQASDAA